MPALGNSDSDIDVLLVRPEHLTPVHEGTWLEQIDLLDRHTQAWTGHSAQIVGYERESCPHLQ